MEAGAILGGRWKVTEHPLTSCERGLSHLRPLTTKGSLGPAFTSEVGSWCLSVCREKPVENLMIKQFRERDCI